MQVVMGLLLPGLLKSKLQEYVQAAILALPIYNISHGHRLGPST